jgi:hypothetical protein
MAILTVTINTDNAAFVENNLNHEIARCLRAVSYRVENGDNAHRKILDTNGNIVGQFDFGDCHIDYAK